MNRFIVDECTGPVVASWLKTKGFDVYSVAENSPGITDDEVLKKAVIEKRILITNDKDFGEMIFKNNLPHEGVIFMRLTDERSLNKIAVLEKLLEEQPLLLTGNTFFMVVTEKNIRINRV